MRKGMWTSRGDGVTKVVRSGRKRRKGTKGSRDEGRGNGENKESSSRQVILRGSRSSGKVMVTTTVYSERKRLDGCFDVVVVLLWRSVFWVRDLEGQRNEG